MCLIGVCVLFCSVIFYYRVCNSQIGKYIPYLATSILNGQSTTPIPLVGFALGDGWVSPLDQTAVYADQAYNMGFLDMKEKNDIDTIFQLCTNLTNAQSWHQAQIVCDGLLSYVVSLGGNFNEDDVTEYTQDEDDDRLERYFSSPAVQSALATINPPTVFSSCSTIVGNALSLDEMQSALPVLNALIYHSSLRIILYSGNFDLNCGLAGTERYLRSILGSSFINSNKQIWTSEIDSLMAGFVRQITIDPSNEVVLPNSNEMNNSSFSSSSSSSSSTADLSYVIVVGAGHLGMYVCMYACMPFHHMIVLLDSIFAHFAFHRLYIVLCVCVCVSFLTFFLSVSVLFSVSPQKAACSCL